MPCEWCHLGHVIILGLNNQPHGGPGVDLFKGGDMPSLWFWGSPGKPGRKHAWVEDPGEGGGTVFKTHVHWL